MIRSAASRPDICEGVSLTHRAMAKRSLASRPTSEDLLCQRPRSISASMWPAPATSDCRSARRHSEAQSSRWKSQRPCCVSFRAAEATERSRKLRRSGMPRVAFHERLARSPVRWGGALNALLSMPLRRLRKQALVHPSLSSGAAAYRPSEHLQHPTGPAYARPAFDISMAAALWLSSRMRTRSG